MTLIPDLTRTFDRRPFRVHLVNPQGRSVGALRYVDGKAEWPTGPLHLGDRFTESQAYAEEAQWIEALRNKGTGYRALAWRIEDE
jgi:hypothetical protein